MVGFTALGLNNDGEQDQDQDVMNNEENEGDAAIQAFAESITQAKAIQTTAKELAEAKTLTEKQAQATALEKMLSGIAEIAFGFENRMEAEDIEIADEEESRRAIDLALSEAKKAVTAVIDAFENMQCVSVEATELAKTCSVKLKALNQPESSLSVMFEQMELDVQEFAKILQKMAEDIVLQSVESTGTVAVLGFDYKTLISLVEFVTNAQMEENSEQALRFQAGFKNTIKQFLAALEAQAGGFELVANSKKKKSGGMLVVKGSGPNAIVLSVLNTVRMAVIAFENTCNAVENTVNDLIKTKVFEKKEGLAEKLRSLFVQAMAIVKIVEVSAQIIESNREEISAKTLDLVRQSLTIQTRGEEPDPTFARILEVLQRVIRSMDNSEYVSMKQMCEALTQFTTVENQQNNLSAGAKALLSAEKAARDLVQELRDKKRAEELAAAQQAALKVKKETQDQEKAFSARCVYASQTPSATAAVANELATTVFQNTQTLSEYAGAVSDLLHKASNQPNLGALFQSTVAKLVQAKPEVLPQLPAAEKTQAVAALASQFTSASLSQQQAAMSNLTPEERIPLSEAVFKFSGI